MNTFAAHKNGASGFTLVEIVFALAIFVMVAATIFSPLSQFRARKTLDAAVEVTLAAFSRAHFDTISSLNDKQYGVHLDADQVVHFAGPTYSAGDPGNSPYVLSSVIEIGAVTLVGGGNNVLFKQLNGATDQSGTFEIRVKATPAVRVVVTVNGTGAVSL